MVIRFTRLNPGQTRFGIFQNITNPLDRRCCGGWYLHIHCAPFFVELYEAVS